MQRYNVFFLTSFVFLSCSLRPNLSTAQVSDTTRKPLIEISAKADEFDNNCEWDDELYLTAIKNFITHEHWLVGMKELSLIFPDNVSNKFNSLTKILVENTTIKINHKRKEGRPVIIVYGYKATDANKSQYAVRFSAESAGGKTYEGSFLFVCKGNRLKYLRGDYYSAIE